MILLLVVLALAVLFLFLLLLIAISNLFVLRSLKSYSGPIASIPVSILVPARNEEEIIGQCVSSLLAQDYPSFEVRVLDDGSTDGTWAILENLAAVDRRLIVSRGEPLPQGWMGKHWACHQLALRATGELLLFTDADTVHAPSMLGRAVNALSAEKADLLTALPRQVMRSFAEKLVMPFSYWAIMAFLPLAIAYHSDNPALSSATGQFMLFRRSAYRQIGGFEAVRNKVVDDVELCKLTRSQGLRWRLLDGRDGYSVRQYKNLGELLEGHIKNFFAIFSNNILVFSLIWLWLVIAFCLPLIILVIGLADPASAAAPLVWLAAAGVAAGFLTWLIAYARFGLPIYLAVLFPFIVLTMFSIGIASAVLNLSGRAAWKGRATSSV